MTRLLTVSTFLILGIGLSVSADEAFDPRNIATGPTIPDEGYCDQPYVVVTDDGHWLCTMTTGRGHEGQAGQHMVATISPERGRTWSHLIDIEPASGPESSWVMPLKVPVGRVYAFYTYNADNVRQVPGGNSPATSRRVDTLGRYVFKFSDDHGRTWSDRRYEIPMRPMRIDRENNTGGDILFFVCSLSASPWRLPSWQTGTSWEPRGGLFLLWSPTPCLRLAPPSSAEAWLHPAARPLITRTAHAEEPRGSLVATRSAPASA